MTITHHDTYIIEPKGKFSKKKLNKLIKKGKIGKIKPKK